MIFNKKKKITIGGFEIDDINDFGIAKYYQKRYESLLDDYYTKITLIPDLQNEISHIRDELYKQEDKIEELRALYESEIEVKEDYKSKANKAIEYIEQHNDYFLLKREVKELLDILKGVDKE